MNRGRLIQFARFQKDRREVGLVRRIREMLRLQAESAVFLIRLPASTDDRTIEEITGIKLHPRLRGEDLHFSSGRRLIHRCCQRQLVFIFLIEHKVMIVPLAQFLDAVADRRRFRHIKRRPFDGPDLARRNQALVHRRIIAGIEGNLMAEDISLAGKIEIRMIRQVYRRGLIRPGFVLDPQPIRSQGINHRAVQIARISFLAVLAEIGKLHCHAIRRFQEFRIPDDFVESHQPAVQMVRSVVGRLPNRFAYRPTIAPKYG